MKEILGNTSLVLLLVLICAVVYLIIEILALKKMIQTNNQESKKLQLLSYERLAVFAERTSLKSLITNAETQGESAAVMHGVLIQNIKSEYDYNLSQQVYVSKEVWSAVTKLKDQNIYVINQLAAMLPPHATSLDLSKRLLEYSLAQTTELHTVVLDAIQHEAKAALAKDEA
jgi:hypothetical protein